jgi:hypothetical protein
MRWGGGGWWRADEAFLGALSTCVGAWAGAVPNPLGVVSCKGGKDEADRDRLAEVACYDFDGGVCGVSCGQDGGGGGGGEEDAVLRDGGVLYG